MAKNKVKVPELRELFAWAETNTFVLPGRTEPMVRSDLRERTAREALANAYVRAMEKAPAEKRAKSRAWVFRIDGAFAVVTRNSSLARREAGVLVGAEGEILSASETTAGCLVRGTREALAELLLNLSDKEVQGLQIRVNGDDLLARHGCEEPEIFESSSQDEDSEDGE